MKIFNYLNFIVLLVFSASSFSQELLLPMATGGLQGEGGIFRYNTEDGTHSTTFMEGSVYAEDFTRFGCNEVSGGIFVQEQNAIYFTMVQGQPWHYASIAWGSIVKYDLDTRELELIYRMSQHDDIGHYPQRGMIRHGDRVYLTCTTGGENSDGTIIYIDLTDDSVHKVFDFEEAVTGAEPTQNLWKEGNKIYGGGRASKDGHGYFIFEYDLDTETYSQVWDGTGWSASNNYDVYDLFVHNGLIYHCLEDRISTVRISDGNHSDYHTFSDLNDPLGYFPIGLTNFQGQWYITCQSGGANKKGSICELHFSGTKVVNVHSFGAKGEYPKTPLIDMGTGKMMGTCKFYTGNNYNGSIYDFTPNNIEEDIKVFESSTDGEKPFCVAVKDDDNKLHAFSSQGGLYGTGVMYEYDLATTTYSKVIDLGFEDGASPMKEILQIDNDHYGVIINNGGFDGYGNLADFDASDNSFESIHQDAGGLFQDYRTNIVEYQGNYYGIGSNVSADAQTNQTISSLYAVDAETNVIWRILNLDASGVDNLPLPRSQVQSNLVQVGDKLYTANQNKIMEIDLTDTTYRDLHSLTNATEGYDVRQLVHHNGVVYGTTEYGGTNGKGTIFKIELASGVFSLLHTMESNKEFAHSILVEDSRLLALTTSDTANGYFGEILKFQLDGSNMTSLHTFDESSSFGYGSYMFSASDGNIYFAKYSGGDNGMGALSRITSSNIIEKLVDFDRTTGTEGVNCGFVERALPTTGLITNQVENQLSVYPNPTATYFSIEGEYDRIEVYSINGVLIKSYNSAKRYSVEELKAGEYIVKAISEDGSSKTNKIIIE